MIKILTKVTSKTKQYFLIQENPTPGSFGDYILLKQDLDKQSKIKKPIVKLSKIVVNNNNFIKKVRETYGELHCEYCGCKLHHAFGRYKATVDHFIPKSVDPEMAFERKNFIISCAKCNQSKSNTIIDTDKINFPYLHTKETLKL